MPPKPQKEIVYPITSDEHFAQIVNQENKKLVGTFIYFYQHEVKLNFY